ncbi:ABC transporter substrate-binding protein [Pukyongiella litopenaei]|nr:ABC transporter substrate-binding protein [Pukyongiella litopenaei]
MRFVSKAAFGSADPHINYHSLFWMMSQSVYDGLVAYKKAEGAESTTVVPDLAEDMPVISNDGKTYTFKIRKGVHFSNGKELTVEDVQASLRRIFKVASPTAGSFYNGIVGAEDCLAAPGDCTLEGGVSVDPGAGTVTINLTRPDAEFLYKLSVPHAYIVPADTPASDTGTVPTPGTGAYMIESYDPNKSVILKRNPAFVEWSVDAQPDGFVDELRIDFGLTEEAQVNAIINGQADMMTDSPPSDRLVEIGTNFADQVHINPQAAFWYVPLNMNIPPFDNLKARQAFAHAVNLNVPVDFFGGPRLASPTCQVLPQGFPGYRPFCLHTKNPGEAWTGPDMEKARALVEASGTQGQKVAVVVDDSDAGRNIGLYLQSVLTDLGYDASVNSISGNIHFTYIQNTNNKVQASVSQWYADYPAAANFLNVLIGCGSFHPGSDSSINISGMCDEKIQARMDQAMALGSTDPEAANDLWSEIDREVMEQVPMVPLFNPSNVDFASKRMGNYMFSPQYHIVYANAWVQ